MNSTGIVLTNDNCAFFDIQSPENLEIVNPGRQLSRVLGKDAEGMSYIDLVCPEDRDAVAESLREVFEEGKNQVEIKRPGRCIRHRVLLPENRVVTVSLTFGYDARGYLVCSVMRFFDNIGGEMENKYRSNNVLESFAISMAAVYINSDGQIAVKYANNDFYSMIGWNRLEFKDYFNECLSDSIIHPEDFKTFRNVLSSLSEQNSEAVFEIRVLNMSGRVRVNEVRTRFLERENEKALITIIFADITERKRLRKELMIKNERYNIVQNNVEITIIDYDAERDKCVLSGNITRLEKYLSVYSYDKRNNEVIIDDFFNGQFALNVMSREDYEKIFDACAEAIVKGGRGEVDIQLCPIGQSVGSWFKWTYSAVKDDMGNVIRIVGNLKNIEKQKRAELLIEKRLKSDMLTGLLNKETAKQQIREFLSAQPGVVSEGEKYHVLMIIDLDNFHLINEYFGHTFGDNVLKEFASDIKSSFRDTDIVGRLVGDRFMVLMKDVTQKFAVKKAGRLCRSLRKNYGVQNNVVVSCSIGVAFFGKDAFDFDGLYQYADRAAYEAKKNGKCAYCIYDSDLEADYSLAKEVSQSSSADYVPSSGEIGEIDSNIIDIAFSLLSASDDIYGTLEILLRTVGRKYNLSTVSLYVKSYHKGERLKAVCQWISNRNLPTRDGRSPLVTNQVDLDAELAGSGIRCISDISTSQIHPSLKNALVNDGMSALVICGLEGRSGETFGYLVFNQFERRRKWSHKETNTFRYIAKILSLALSGKYAEQSLKYKSID